MIRPLSTNSSRTIGVIVCMNKKRKRIPPFGESGFFRQLTEEARASGLNLIVFCPKDVNWQTRKVHAWSIAKDGTWKSRIHELPKLIYDRCFYNNSAMYLHYRPYLNHFRDDPWIRLLGRPLGGKIKTYQILQKSKFISPFLPETIIYRHPKDVLRIIDKYKKALIKPNGGSHGIGVVAIIPQKNGFLLRGRTKQNLPFQTLVPSEQFANWIHHFIGNNRYIIQPFLSLSTVDGRPFDLRILLQKNGEQVWERTGLAIRLGKSASITSNLHGGGNAKKVDPFLHQHFPPGIVRGIWEQIEFLSHHVPKHVEEHHGPLVELGLDIGIDRRGKAWILELNSKPGRSVFLHTGELDVRKRAIQLPILYAKSLLLGQIGGGV